MAAATDKKSILILGGTGFVGQELGLHFVRLGHSVRLATRRPDDLRGRLAFPCSLHAWKSVNDPVPAAALEGCDVVVNLVGESIASHAWTSKRRARIRDSRLDSVAALGRGLQAMQGPRPKVLIQSSAIGFYGDRGDEELREGSAPGRGFLAETCTAWEAAARELEAPSGLRLVTCRFGMVLGASGGALPQLQFVYSLGLGGRLGSGKQWVSWIHIDDLVRLISTAVDDERWRGVVNVSSPEPCTFAAFNRALGVEGRYGHWMAVPKPAVKIVMGRRSALVLDSARVRPEAARRLGFEFRFKDIEGALRDLCGGSDARHINRIVVRQWIPIPPDRLWPFFTDAHNLEKLVPPFLRFHVDKLSTPEIRDGTHITYRLKLHGLPIGWQSLISEWEPGRMFVDEQLRGPYALWRHLHAFEPLAGGTVMTDDVRYRVPLAPLGALAAGLYVQKDVRKIFEYRTRVLADAALLKETFGVDDVSGGSLLDGGH